MPEQSTGRDDERKQWKARGEREVRDAGGRQAAIHTHRGQLREMWANCFNLQSLQKPTHLGVAVTEVTFSENCRYSIHKWSSLVSFIYDRGKKKFKKCKLPKKGEKYIIMY